MTAFYAVGAIALWFAVSCALGLILGAIIKWGAE
jgi:hypothetical protein